MKPCLFLLSLSLCFQNLASTRRRRSASLGSGPKKRSLPGKKPSLESRLSAALQLSKGWSLGQRALKLRLRKESKSLSRRLNFGLPSPNGGVTAGAVSVAFPPLPLPSNTPITINTPEAAYPTVVASERKQGPIVVVPQVQYPRKIHRKYVHHKKSIQGYYGDMMMNSPYWAGMAMQNPYYQQFLPISANRLVV